MEALWDRLDVDQNGSLTYEELTEPLDTEVLIDAAGTNEGQYSAIQAQMLLTRFSEDGEQLTPEDCDNLLTWLQQKRNVALI